MLIATIPTLLMKTDAIPTPSMKTDTIPTLSMKTVTAAGISAMGVAMIRISYANKRKIAQDDDEIEFLNEVCATFYYHDYDYYD